MGFDRSSDRSRLGYWHARTTTSPQQATPGHRARAGLHLKHLCFHCRCLREAPRLCPQQHCSPPLAECGLAAAAHPPITEPSAPVKPQLLAAWAGRAAPGCQRPVCSLTASRSKRSKVADIHSHVARGHHRSPSQLPGLAVWNTVQPQHTPRSAPLSQHGRKTAPLQSF